AVTAWIAPSFCPIEITKASSLTEIATAFTFVCSSLLMYGSAARTCAIPSPRTNRPDRPRRAGPADPLLIVKESVVDELRLALIRRPLRSEEHTSELQSREKLV